MARCVCLSQKAGHFPVTNVLTVFVVLPVFFLSKVESGVIVAVADLTDFLVDIARQNKPIRSRTVGIDRPTVRGGDAGSIVCRFVAPFDLKRVNSGCD